MLRRWTPRFSGRSMGARSRMKVEVRFTGYAANFTYTFRFMEAPDATLCPMRDLNPRRSRWHPSGRWHHGDMTPAHGVSGFLRRPQPIKPKAGQESVWDYPRPPRVEPRSERVIVRLGGQVIADTTDAVRVLETSHPPVYYLPMDAFPAGALVPVEGTTLLRVQGGSALLRRRRRRRRCSPWRMDLPGTRPGFRGAQYPGGPLPRSHGLLRGQRRAGDLAGG